MGLPESEMETLRGDRMAMIFQEPMTSLNPVMTIGAQVAEALVVHRGLSRRDARRRGAGGARGGEDPLRRAAAVDEYPHQFSGGMRQRVMIAMALACEPAVLIADEPTTALDVTIQAQVLGLLATCRSEHGMAMLFITHNLGVVAQIADRVAVMYAGEIVETGPGGRDLRPPPHPYTRALFAAMPRMDLEAQELAAIAGRVPGLDAMSPPGTRPAWLRPISSSSSAAAVPACSAALHLAKRGARVVLLERGLVGSQASGVTSSSMSRRARLVSRVAAEVRAGDAHARSRRLPGSMSAGGRGRRWDGSSGRSGGSGAMGRGGSRHPVAYRTSAHRTLCG